MHKKSSVHSSNVDVPQKVSLVSSPGLAPALIEFKILFPALIKQLTGAFDSCHTVFIIDVWNDPIEITQLNSF